MFGKGNKSNFKIIDKIAAKVESVYTKYKNYPEELGYVLEGFLEALDEDKVFRSIEKLKIKPTITESYLCSDCAMKNGAIWPEGHAATFHVSDCDICGEEKSLSHTSDWNWPDHEYLQKGREV